MCKIDVAIIIASIFFISSVFAGKNNKYLEI